MRSSQVDVSPFLEDSSGYHGAAECAFIPRDLAEVQEIVVEASARGVPLTVAGAGTGLTGARVPQSGWVISLDRFRNIEVTGNVARCGSGATLAELQVVCAKTNQFFGPNPTETTASVGGVISTNAGGARSFRFGPVRKQVHALHVVFMDGRAIRLERGEHVNFTFDTVRVPETTKNSAGYYLQSPLDWVDLIAGSEGTLGIVVEAELTLQPEPESVLGGVVFFESEESVFDAVENWRSIEGLRQLEMMDFQSLQFLRPRYPDIPTSAKAALLIEQDLRGADDPEIDFWLDRLSAGKAMENESWFGITAAERERFRQFRHVLPTMMVEHGRRSGIKYGSDFAVPLDQNRNLYEFYKSRCEDLFPRRYAIFGHIGDANLHVNLLATGGEEAEKAEGLMQNFAEYAVALGGTVAAEHGIGKHKTKLLRLMYDQKEIDAMKAVKRELDPKWLLGRGTVFDL